MKVLPVVLASMTFSAIGDLRAEDAVPAVGDQAKDFTLRSVDGKEVQLSALTAQGPVVLLVLRGYPGYQCPICTTQVGDYIGKSKQFESEKAQVVLVYPGPAKGLAKFAKEFVRGKTLPENFHLVTDPDYEMVNSYKLRWDAPKETAYPSTFVIAKGGKILLSQVSKSHGGRTRATDSLEALRSKK
jgi:peroxiredoxin